MPVCSGAQSRTRPHRQRASCHSPQAVSRFAGLYHRVREEPARSRFPSPPPLAAVLPRHSARRLAMLEKAGLVDHKDRIVIRQMLNDIIADDFTQAISIPIPATEYRLLPPRARIARCLCAHPTSFALLISKQTFQKQACVRRNTLLPEQRMYPRLDLPKRRRPQRKRLFNRRCLRPRSSNHGCPWTQRPSEKATVMLGGAPGRRVLPARYAQRWRHRFISSEDPDGARPPLLQH
jgi:hypothetical protein